MLSEVCRMRMTFVFAVFLGIALIAAKADAQSAPPGASSPSEVPPAIAAQIRALGPTIDVPGVRRIYAPLLAAQPTAGIRRIPDVAYGPDSQNLLDIYTPERRAHAPAPVLLFVPGGAFMRADKAGYANIGYAFARAGIVTIIQTYRLAPAHPWPAGGEDVAAALRWTRTQISRYGGDPNRIVLMGQSAGATHAATYAYTPSLQPREGPGIAGLVLLSGVYDVGLDLQGAASFGGSPALDPDRAYYGADPLRYPQESILGHLDGKPVPTLLFEAELDPVMMVVQTADLFTALCRRNATCPRLYRLLEADHLSEVFAIGTGDTSVTRPVIDFIEALSQTSGS